MSGYTDITNARFGRLIALRPVGSNPRREMQWLCRCDCGTEQTKTAHLLLSGKTHSCGCLRREIQRALHTTHSDMYSPEWWSWTAMRARCSNPNRINYGGRGIKVCNRWSSYANFLADMGRKPTPTHTIDRINSDGNYEPSNCKWATPKEQRANRRPRHR